MGMGTKIEWCHATFNPWIGCTRVSPGCVHCYAETLMDHRYGRVKWGPDGVRSRTSASNWRKPLQWDKEAQALNTRYRVFCASLADVFEDITQLIDWRLELFELIKKTPHLDWLVLTKRPEVACDFFRFRPDFLLDNIWIGTSVEDQKRADERREIFKTIPAKIKFVSYEPAIGPVNWRGWEFIDWMICGGESGPDARPMHPSWARVARDWSIANKIAFHFKQWGEYSPKISDNELELINFKGQKSGVYEGELGDYKSMYRVGKKEAGRTLDGRTWDEFPS